VDLVSEGEDGVKQGGKPGKGAQAAAKQLVQQQQQGGRDVEGGTGSLELQQAEAAALEVLRK
jgi:hypothetical protein